MDRFDIDEVIRLITDFAEKYPNSLEVELAVIASHMDGKYKYMSRVGSVPVPSPAPKTYYGPSLVDMISGSDKSVVVKPAINTTVGTELGTKADDDKMRFDLLPPYSLFEIAKVFTQGAKKYADRNWELGMAWGRVYAAMLRHALKWWDGETYDTETGAHHLAAVAFGAIVLMQYEHSNIGVDTRSKHTGGSVKVAFPDKVMN